MEFIVTQRAFEQTFERIQEVIPVFMGSWAQEAKRVSSTIFTGALTPQSVDLAVVIDTVVLQDGQLDLLMLVLNLLGSRVILLLAFLAATTETEDQVKS